MKTPADVSSRRTGGGRGAAGRARTGNHLLANPFTLGVASGDPAPDGVVLWTRSAPNPLADDGLGGMPSRPVNVEWESPPTTDSSDRAPRD